MQVFLTFDNQGNPSYGQNEWSVGGVWSNVGGFGHSLSYTFTRSFKGLSSANTATYTAPLPWQDRIEIGGSYTNELNYPAGRNNPSGYIGHDPQATLRYVHNLPPQDFSDKVALQQDVQIGYDFKGMNDATAANDGNVYLPIQIDQFPVIYDATLTDPWGQTVLQNTLMESPGGLTSANTTQAFRKTVLGASARYVYDNINLTRTTNLPLGSTWIVRAQGQVATGNLTSSEQLCLGGMKTVRGYAINSYCGSEGMVVNNEVWSPAVHPGGLLPRSLPVEDSTQIAIFLDYGRVAWMNPIRTPDTPIWPPPAPPCASRPAAMSTSSSMPARNCSPLQALTVGASSATSSSPWHTETASLFRTRLQSIGTKSDLEMGLWLPPEIAMPKWSRTSSPSPSCHLASSSSKVM